MWEKESESEFPKKPWWSKKKKKKPINTEFYIQQTSFREIKIFSDEGKLREYVASWKNN